jgi:RNA polymerase-interacting CarD/CdnL/TRCF family regulator
MFAINDCVFYSTTGVCRITDIRFESFRGSEAQEYYVLKPFFKSNSITYISTADDELLAKIRPILTKDEIYSLIMGMPDAEEIWISDDRERDRAFGTKVRTGDSHDLVQLIKSLYLEKDRKKEQGKKLNTSDFRIMTTAEKLLHEEFAVVLEINVDEVVPFIQARISGLSQSA